MSEDEKRAKIVEVLREIERRCRAGIDSAEDIRKWSLAKIAELRRKLAAS